MRKTYLNIGLSLLLLSAGGCAMSPQQQTKDVAAVHQEKKVDQLILMHSPMGVRAEYNISQSTIELWINPKAGEDNSYKMRNFSNRDDHTKIFDKISFPALSAADYVSTDYDPWHTVVHYKNQDVHIATLEDSPVFYIWTSKAGMIDFKTDKQDTPIKRAERSFVSAHPDRGLNFEFAAVLKGGDFQHQLQIDQGRSTYCRAEMVPNQPIFIGGALKGEHIERKLQQLAAKGQQKLMADNDKEVIKETAFGKLVLNDHDSLQNLIDFNKRIFLSAQDKSGAMQAALQKIYYLIWVRDGGLACSWMAYSGWANPLDKWTDFQMANPTNIEENGRTGRFFGQMANGKITKWQEDGLFYAVWSAFTYWTQTNDTKYISKDNLKLMMEACDWLEDYCYDQKEGLFYRQYFCETPLYNSRDFGWDNAVGKPVLGWDAPPYKGKKIERSYDIYINLFNYSVYRMLHEVCEVQGVKNNYAEKAEALVEKMKPLFPEGKMPYYGKAVATDGTVLMADGYGLDETDYIWALTCPPFFPKEFDIDRYQKTLFDDLLVKKDEYFLAGYFSILATLEMDDINQDDLRKAIDYAAKECYIPWKNMPMAGAMVEMSGFYPAGSNHQIRPQIFSMGAWFGAMTNIAVKRLPHGLALQAGKLVKEINDYQYRGKLVDFKFEGEGTLDYFTVNGKKVTASNQIPDAWLNKDKNEVVGFRSTQKTAAPKLLSSTIELLDLQEAKGELSFTFISIAEAQIVLSNSTAEAIDKLTDANGTAIRFHTNVNPQGNTVISFDHKGELNLKVKQAGV
ncbi:hypothetical protein [Persicobacter psychrovividus]|uniref:Uncharacterized protein n=1 Tax=Persicobacter psychrovividus TaxID=387638 RepID=A0ABM7VJU4_9BACT|nr:hypothetical protein PEPS_35430 [Persicobacter psychrovividus]